jgi:rhodanese-related sulfurtransferase
MRQIFKNNMNQKIVSIIFVVTLVIIGAFVYQKSANKTSTDDQVATQQTLATISPVEFKQRAESGEYTMIDVRTPQEIDEGKIDLVALEIDFYEPNFQEEIAKLNRDAQYLIYCRSGNRSGQALQIMRELGFTEVYELEGGKNAWDASGLYLAPVAEVQSDTSTFSGRIIEVDAERFSFSQQEIRVKQGESVALKINNTDTLHGINIPSLGQNSDEFLVLDTSKVGEYPFRCSNMCGVGHRSMGGLLIIEE